MVPAIVTGGHGDRVVHLIEQKGLISLLPMLGQGKNGSRFLLHKLTVKKRANTDGPEPIGGQPIRLFSAATNNCP